MKRMLFNLAATGVLLLVAACGGGDAPPEDTNTGPDLTSQIENDANQIPYVSSGQTVQGALGGNITAQLYAFNATQGDTVTASMTQAGGSTLDPYLVLISFSGAVIGVDDNSNPAAPNAAQVQAEIPQDGTYFAIASTSQTIDGVLSETIEGEQTYSLSISGHTPPAEQGTRILYYRTDLQYNTRAEQRGFSSPAEPVYFYGFQGQAGDTINIVMETSELDAMLSLYDPDGNRIAVNDDSSTVTVTNTTDAAVADVTLPATGTYLILATDVYFHQLVEDYDGGFFDMSVNQP